MDRNLPAQGMFVRSKCIPGTDPSQIVCNSFLDQALLNLLRPQLRDPLSLTTLRKVAILSSQSFVILHLADLEPRRTISSSQSLSLVNLPSRLAA